MLTEPLRPHRAASRLQGIMPSVLAGHPKGNSGKPASGWGHLAVSKLAILLAIVVLDSCRATAEPAKERELLRDPGFRCGFTLLEPAPGKRVPCGIIRGPETNSGPVWDLAQWSSKHPLASAAPELLADGSWRYTNAAKSVTLGFPGSARGDLGLAVRASMEYGTRARQSGEPWVHLLAEQKVAHPPTLAELSAARLHVEARLLASVNMAGADYRPSRHAAQFQIFFTVQNLNRQSPGYGHYLWFGVPLYDNRHRVVPAHRAQDTGGTLSFIYSLSSDVFTDASAHDGAWILIDKDLRPLLCEGLAYAWRNHYLQESQELADYRITAINLGWELPGTFDVDLEIRRLSLKASYGNAGARQP